MGIRVEWGSQGGESGQGWFNYLLPDKNRSFSVHLRQVVVVDVELREQYFVLVTGHCALIKKFSRSQK